MSRQLSQLLAGREATGSGDVRPVANAHEVDRHEDPGERYVDYGNGKGE